MRGRQHFLTALLAVVAVLTLILFVINAMSAFAQDDGEPDPRESEPDSKATICHNGNTIASSENAVYGWVSMNIAHRAPAAPTTPLAPLQEMHVNGLMLRNLLTLQMLNSLRRGLPM